jgi:ribosome assembly protein 4
LKKVWDDAGKLVRELKGHAHWVNSIALNTDYALRTGCFGEKPVDFEDNLEKMKEVAL